MKINFSPPDITELEINEVVEALKSGWITTGPRTKELERRIATYLGTPKAVCLNSATAALEMILRVLGVGPGDEVITSAYSYTASASPVVHVGAKLVLIDTAPNSYEMDYDQVAAAITDKTKAIIPVAGLGTRMLPATKAIPKEMLTLVDKPLIQYVVNECVAAGIKEIVLVTHSSKNAIENHFDTSFELETMLEKRVKRQLLEEVRSICPKDVTIMHVRQGNAKGLGHAVLCGRPVVGNEPFAVVLPDVLLADFTANQKKENLSAMIKRFKETKASQIMVAPVSADEVSSYGIADCGGVELKGGDSVKINSIVEKPSVEDAPSNLAVVGRYVFSAEIWDLLERTPVGVGDEIQLTDAIDMLIEKEIVEAFHMTGRSFDCGDKIGYMEAFVEYGLRHDKLGKEFKAFLKDLAKTL